MKKFREANADLYEVSRDEKLAHDLALITEKGEDICSIPIDQLKSKLMKDRHKKMCKGSDHWSQTTKKKLKDTPIQRAAKRAGMSRKNRRGLFNSLDEADMQNLIVHIQDITKDMIKALKRNDQRTLDGLYKNLGKVIK
tara:strand:- start:87 stop:503 length:417 start_codon:yes stop_codon:yes gene_type:complete